LAFAWAIGFLGASRLVPAAPRLQICSPTDQSNWSVLTPDGRTFLKSYNSADQTAQIVHRWDAFSGERLPSFPLPLSEPGELYIPATVPMIAVVPKGKQVIEFRHIDTGEWIAEFAGAFVRSGDDWKTLIHESIDQRQVSVLDLIHHTHRLTVSLDHPPPVPSQARAAAISSDGKLLAVGDGATVRFWDMDSGAELPSLAGKGPPIRSVAFAVTGQYLATRAVSPGPEDEPADDDVACIWQLPSRQLLAAVAVKMDYRLTSPDIGFDPFAEEVHLWSDEVPLAEFLRQPSYYAGKQTTRRDLKKVWGPGRHWAALLDGEEGTLDLRSDRESFRLWASNSDETVESRPSFSPEGRYLFLGQLHRANQWDDWCRSARKQGLLGPPNRMDFVDLHDWDLETREEGPLLRGYPTDFSQDGRTLVTRCFDDVCYNFYDLPIRRPMGTILMCSAAPPLLVLLAYVLLQSLRRWCFHSPPRTES
jgi:WD40 repeat protein